MSEPARHIPAAEIAGMLHEDGARLFDCGSDDRLASRIVRSFEQRGLRLGRACNDFAAIRAALAALQPATRH